MLFLPMEKSQIAKVLDASKVNEMRGIQIILINGATVFGTWPLIDDAYSNASIFDAFETRNNNGNFLKLYYNKTSNEHFVFIPLDHIAGVSEMVFNQETRELEGDVTCTPVINKSAYEMMFDNLLNQAQIQGFLFYRNFVMHQLNVTKPFKYGDLTFNGNANLYCDWEYLRRISGGINTIGISSPFFGVSIGWEKSLASIFKDKMALKATSISQASVKSEAILSGYINFIERYLDFPSLEKKCDTIEMEGSRWIQAILSQTKVKSLNKLKSGEWCLVYFKNDCFGVNKELLERTGSPIKIFGEVIQCQIATEIGTVSCAIKARCGTMAD